MSFFSPSLKAHKSSFDQDLYDKKSNFLSYPADDIFANMREDFAKLFHENNLDLFTNASDLGLPQVLKHTSKSPKAALNQQSGFFEGAYTTLPPLPSKSEPAPQKNTIPSLSYSPMRYVQGESNYTTYMTEPNGGSFNNKTSFSPNLAALTPSRPAPKYQEDPYGQFDFFENYDMKDFPDPDDFVDTYADDSLSLMWSNDAAKALKHALSQPVQSGQSPEPEPQQMHHSKSVAYERPDNRTNNHHYHEGYKTEFVDYNKYQQNFHPAPVKSEFEGHQRPMVAAQIYNERTPDFSKEISPRKMREQPRQNDFIVAQKKPKQTWDDDEDDKDDGKGRSSRGLRVLSLKVRDIVHEKKKTTYKEVAETLMSEVEGPYKTKSMESKEEQNVKRRVYDALNVLIAAGVIKKEGKLVSCAEDVPYIGGNSNKREVKGKSSQLQQKLAELKKRKQAKLDNLQEILYKTLAVKHLVKRNKDKALNDYMQGVPNNSVSATKIGVHDQNAAFQNSNGDIIKFPFLVVVSSTANNSMNLNMDVSQKQLAIESRFALNIFGDIDVLLKMRLHNVSRSFFEQTIPEGLEKFLPRTFLDNLY